MKHRHLNAQTWSSAAIDSVLERGDLPDWRELFAAVRQSREVADGVLRAASAHDTGGTSALVKALMPIFRESDEAAPQPAPDGSP